MKKRTAAVDQPFRLRDPYGALSMPVYHSVAFEFDDAATMSDAFCGRLAMPDYARVMNPTVTYFEDKVKAITGAADVTAFNSGMAAISNCLMALAASGKNIVTSRHLFGNTFSLIAKTLVRFGVRPKLCDLTDIEQVRKTVDENTCCVFLEIITNPQMEVADLSALSEVAHSVGAPLVADTTVIPFTESRSHDMGVDVEVVSSTKYISGGATSLGGLVIDYGTHPTLAKTINFEMLFNMGAYMTPHVAYMQSLGLETLEVRYHAQAANAQLLAERLSNVQAIKRVNYIGLKDNPYYGLARKQFGGTSGAMLTIDLENQEACYAFMNNLKLVRRATNLFDHKTLAIHPASTIFGNFTDRQRAQMDVLDTTIRISVGLEDNDDIFNDIVQALP